MGLSVRVGVREGVEWSVRGGVECGMECEGWGGVRVGRGGV